MNTFTNEELCLVITHTANALKELAAQMDVYNNVLKNIVEALNDIEVRTGKLSDE